MYRDSVVYLVDLIGKYNLTLADVDFLVKGKHLHRLDKNGRAGYKVLTDAFVPHLGADNDEEE